MHTELSKNIMQLVGMKLCSMKFTEYEVELVFLAEKKFVLNINTDFKFTANSHYNPFENHTSFVEARDLLPVIASHCNNVIFSDSELSLFFECNTAISILLNDTLEPFEFYIYTGSNYGYCEYYYV